MPAERAEAFLVALAALRERLRQGAFAPGARIAAAEQAEVLGLSATPVREALSRLAGEGLLEDRRGQGVFVRMLTGPDIADLYQMSLALLLIALAPGRGGVAGPDPAPAPADPVGESEQIFALWVARAGGRVLAAAHRRVQLQLGPVRRREPQLFADLDAELFALRATAGDLRGRIAAARAFHARRVAVSDRLAALLEQVERPEV